MDFLEYKISFYKRWQKRILRSCRGLFCIALVFEAAITLYHLFSGDVPAGSFLRYAVEKLVCPLLISVLILSAATRLLRVRSLSMAMKNRIVMFAFLFLLAVISFFYNRYPVVLIFPSAAIFLSALLGDKRLLLSVFVSSMLLTGAAAFIWNIRIVTPALEVRVITIAVSLAAQCVSYFLAGEILDAQRGLIRFIYQSYVRQRELTNELQLEPLTRLYNRTAYAAAVERHIKLAAASDAPVIQAFIDMDNFKRINDEYGHASGDAVLISFSEMIVRNIGGNRSAFRYGGDEFVVLFKNKTVEQVQAAMERLRNEFEDTRFDFMDEDTFCTISIGIAVYHKGWNSKQWFEAADNAAYAAKSRGKNQLEIAL